MLKVLHVLASSDVAGAERVATQIALGARSEITSAYASPYGDRLARFLADVGVAYVPLRRMVAREVRREIRRLDPAILHAHDYRASVLAAMTAGRRPVISHLHSNPPWAGRLCARSLAYLVALRRIDRVVLASQSIGDSFLAPARLARKSVLIPNVVDPVLVRRLAGSLPPRQVDLLFVGRLAEEKNPVEFIRIVASLRATFPRVRAALIGDGPLMPICRKEIEVRGMGDAVRLLGFQPNPYPWICGAAMLVVPSRFEGFGLAALEALLFGVPVIASPTGGLAEMIRSSGGGRIAYSHREFVEIAMEWVANPDNRRRAGEMGRRWAETHCNVENYIARFRNLYDDLTKPPPGDLLAVA